MRRWGPLLAATLFFAVCTVALTYPVTFRVGTHLAGTPGEDAMQHLWISWWTVHALIDLGVGPAQADVLYYPDGANHPMLAVTPYPAVAAMPLALLLGPLPAYNVHWLLTFLLSALAAYLLVLYLTGNRFAAVLAGFVFAFFPNRMAQSTAHFAQIVTYFFPLVALYLIRLKRRPSVRTAVVFGALLALALLVNIVHIAYMLLPMLAVFLAYWLVVDRARLRVAAPFLALSLAVAAALTGPFLVPFVWETATGGLNYLSQGGVADFSADLLGFVVPAASHPLLQGWSAFRDFAARLIGGGSLRENTVYLGWIPLALALWAVLRLRLRRTLPWVLLAGLTFVLSLGPTLKLAGNATGIPMPYAWAQLLPFYKWGRVPGRFNEAIILGLAVLAGLGFVRLLRGRPSAQPWLAAVLVAVIGLEYLTVWPFPTMPAAAPPFLEDWARDPKDYAVLDLPQWPLWLREGSNYAMFYQTAHEHPIVGGYVWRLPGGREGTMKAFQELLWPDGQSDIVPRRRGAEAIPLLNQYRIRYVLVHPNALPPEDRENDVATVRRALGEPLFSGPEIVAFAVPPAATPDPQEALTSFGYNWYLVEPIDGQPSRWLMNDGPLCVHWLLEPAGEFWLEVTVEPFRTARRLQLTVNGEPTGEATIGERRRVEFGPFRLKRGGNEILFHVPEGCEVPADVVGNEDRRCLSLLFQDLELRAERTAQAESVETGP